MAGRLWWLNPVTGEATEAVDEPPYNVGTVGDLPVTFMRLSGVAGLAACGYDATVITRGGSGFGQLFRVPTAPVATGHIRNVQVPSSTRNVQVPSSTRNVQYIP